MKKEKEKTDAAIPRKVISHVYPRPWTQTGKPPMACRPSVISVGKQHSFRFEIRGRVGEMMATPETLNPYLP